MKILQNRKFIIISVALLVVVVVATVLYVRTVAAAKNTLTASGTVETTQVSIASEVSGKIAAVNVQEGDSVKAGGPLFVLDETLFQQQRKVALANLEAAQAASQTSETALGIAQAQYQVALQAALAQDETTRLGDWLSVDQRQFDQPNWYFARAEQANAAQGLVDRAKKELDDAKEKLTEVASCLDKADFLAAEQRLLDARLEYLTTKDVNERAQNANVTSQPITPYNLRNCAKDQKYHFASPDVMNLSVGCGPDHNLTKSTTILYDNARDELSQAQQAYNKLLTSCAAREVLQARADVSVAQEHYYGALDRLRALQTGDQSLSVTAAQGVVDQAQSAYDQSLKAVAQMQANLDLLDAQLAKSTVYAPMDGVILSRVMEPGEFVQEGNPVLIMADISQLTITVYMPEDRYGQISLGQKATMSIDSFPGELFNAEVKQISDQAEFTPRNVQTTEGRSTTVYAINLKVSDPDGRLRPGMPADVTFIMN